VRLETRPDWIRLGQTMLAHAGPGGGWQIAAFGGHPLPGGAPRPLRAARPGQNVVDRPTAPGETPPLLPPPDAHDHARSPSPLPVRILIAWPGLLLGLSTLFPGAWYAEGPLVPLGEGPGTPEPTPGLWDLLRAEGRALALPDQGWAWLLPAATAHARLAQAEVHGQAAVEWRYQDRGDATLRLQRLGPLLCLTEVRGGSDVLLGTFPA
jgi:hypothetical protein